MTPRYVTSESLSKSERAFQAPTVTPSARDFEKSGSNSNEPPNPLRVRVSAGTRKQPETATEADGLEVCEKPISAEAKTRRPANPSVTLVTTRVYEGPRNVVGGRYGFAPEDALTD